MTLDDKPLLPQWPARPPAFGPIVLRKFSAGDVPMVMEMSTDPYIPLIGSLPAGASEEEALAYVQRQRGRWAEGTGFSFAIAEADTDRAVGGIGLWLRPLSEGRATAGYSVAPSERGRGVAGAALTALTSFAWTIPALHRIELYIEPWNLGSIGTAERAGYEREGLLRSRQEIGGRRRDMLLYASIRSEEQGRPESAPTTGLASADVAGGSSGSGIRNDASFVGSTSTNPIIPPAAATHSVACGPIRLPRNPPPSAPSGLVP